MSGASTLLARTCLGRPSLGRRRARRRTRRFTAQLIAAPRLAAPAPPIPCLHAALAIQRGLHRQRASLHNVDEQYTYWPATHAASHAVSLQTDACRPTGSALAPAKAKVRRA